MSSYWEKLVDLYVDGECSSEERLALEARAKVEPDLCRAMRETENLRALMREIPNKPPKEFEARLRESILNSNAWDAWALQREAEGEIDAARTGRAFVGAFRRVFNPVAIGTVAALLVGASVLYACLCLAFPKNKNADQNVVAQAERISENAVVDGEASQPWILIPSPAGNPSEPNSKADSQENFWVVVRVEDKVRAKKQKLNLQARCAELDVNYSKVGDDEQFRLTDVSKGQWLQIADDWNESDCEFSNALTNWDDGVRKTQTIRVVFKLEPR